MVIRPEPHVFKDFKDEKFEVTVRVENQSSSLKKMVSQGQTLVYITEKVVYPEYGILMKYKDRLKEYFGDVEIKSPQEEAAETSQNHWKVINCKAEELEEILNKLHKIGRVQLAVARYEDEVTLIVNEIGYII